MPTFGTGTDVSKGLKKFNYGLYMCGTATAGAIPGAKLVASEPATPWVKQGRIRADEITWNVPDPGFFEGRAGFKQTLKWRVVNQAEIPIVTAVLDEADAEVMNRLRGGSAGAATSLSSSSYTGYQFIYTPGLYYAAKVLLVGISVSDNAERHILASNCYVTFKPSDAAGAVSTVDVTIAMAGDSSGYAFTQNDWTAT